MSTKRSQEDAATPAAPTPQLYSTCLPLESGNVRALRHARLIVHPPPPFARNLRLPPFCVRLNALASPLPLSLCFCQIDAHRSFFNGLVGGRIQKDLLRSHHALRKSCPKEQKASVSCFARTVAAHAFRLQQ
jgi:hypothetical protein